MLPADFAKQAYLHINKTATLIIRFQYSDDTPDKETIDSGELIYVHLNNDYLSYRFKGTKDDINTEIALHSTYNKYIEAPKNSKAKDQVITVVRKVIDVECVSSESF